MRNKNILAGLSLLGLVAGCGSSSEGGLKSCVEDHMKEKLSEMDSITECLVDELAKNFATQADCEAFVTANGGYADTRVQACKNYFEEKEKSKDGGATTD
jgi:Fe-S cluster biogenesis protein NfuA